MSLHKQWMLTNLLDNVTDITIDPYNGIAILALTIQEIPSKIQQHEVGR